MRLRSATAGETGTPEAADVSSSAAGARGDAPRDIGDYELELIYSGESDGETESKEAKAKKNQSWLNRSRLNRLLEKL
uniref:Uncharacterized protein n=1 Tax=Hyaloperonospora arabidopsidis (strain Emoy2) TaxID=559515 RepID=M4BHI8_HYAAE